MGRPPGPRPDSQAADVRKRLLESSRVFANPEGSAGLQTGSPVDVHVRRTGKGSSVPHPFALFANGWEAPCPLHSRCLRTGGKLRAPSIRAVCEWVGSSVPLPFALANGREAVRGIGNFQRLCSRVWLQPYRKRHKNIAGVSPIGASKRRPGRSRGFQPRKTQPRKIPNPLA